MKVLHRPRWDDAARVQTHVTGVVVPLDMIEIHGLRDRGPLIEFAHEFHQIGIVGDPAYVALEVHIIDGVEANKGRKQPPIRFGNLRSTEIAARSQQLFELVQRRKDLAYGFLVFFLCRRKAGAVDAVIDVTIDALVERRSDREDPRDRGRRRALAQWSNSELNIRMMSPESLLTIFPVTVSQSTGTVTRPV